MEEKFKLAIEEYQCTGCVCGDDIECFNTNSICGIGCGKHVIGTSIFGIVHILLGLPNGFNRIGKENDLKPIIF